MFNERKCGDGDEGVRGLEDCQKYIVNKLQTNCKTDATLLLGKYLGMSFTYTFILTFSLFPGNIACYKRTNS